MCLSAFRGTIYLTMNKILLPAVSHVCRVVLLPQGGLPGRVRCKGEEASFSLESGFGVIVGTPHPYLDEAKTKRSIRVGSKIVALVEGQSGEYVVSGWCHEDEYRLALVNAKNHQQVSLAQHVPKKCCHGGKPAMPRRYPSLGGAVSAC